MKLFIFILTLFVSQICAQVELYEHGKGSVAFPGQTWKLEKPGYYQSDWGHFADNAVSCVLVPEGYSVILWEHPKAWNQGRKLELEAGIHDLGALNFNDVLTGVTVIRKQKARTVEEDRAFERAKKRAIFQIDGFAKRVSEVARKNRILVFDDGDNNFFLYVAIRLRFFGCNADIVTSVKDNRRQCIDKGVRYFVELKNGKTLVLCKVSDSLKTETGVTKDLEKEEIVFDTTAQSKRVYDFAKKAVESKNVPGIFLIEDALRDAGARMVETGKPGITVVIADAIAGDIASKNGTLGIVLKLEEGKFVVAVQNGDKIEQRVFERQDSIIYRPVP